MTPFVLNFAKPVTPARTPIVYGYSDEQQVNLTANGDPAIGDPDVMAMAGPTYSTAGSSTNADDTD